MTPDFRYNNSGFRRPRFPPFAKCAKNGAPTALVIYAEFKGWATRHHYTYDAENRITQVDSGSTASYVYNENGKRVRKNTGSTWTEYFYGPNGSVQSEYNGTSYPAQYVYAGDRLIAEYENSTTEFIHADHLGSTRLVTAVNGTVTDSLDYYPFGQQSVGGTSTTHKFTGKERDTESGLDNFGARYFGSSLGRFETPDPLPWLSWQRGNSRDHDRFTAFLGNPQNLNLYAYVDNNPLNRTDPTGMYICNGDAQQCKAVQNSLDAVKRAADTLSKGTDKEQALAKKLNGILGFYGKAGVDNGVKVGFADLSGSGQVGKTSTSSFFGLFKSTTITFDYHAFSHSYAFGAETAAHEGAHGVDGPIQTTFFGTPKWSSVLGTETHAYQAEAAVDRGLGMNTASDGDSPVWNTGWGAAAEANSTNAINANATSNAVADCAASGGCNGQP